jgi:hypothetical protein
MQELSPIEGQARGINAEWLASIREQGLNLVSKVEKVQQQAQTSKAELLRLQKESYKDKQQLFMMRKALTEAVEKLTDMETRDKV